MNHQGQQLLCKLEELEAIRESTHEGKNLRQFTRHVVRGDAELLSTERKKVGHEPISIQLRDCGRGGIGFLSTQPIEGHSIWHLSVLQHEVEVAHVTVMVRHCRSVGPNLYLCGAMFVASDGLMSLLGVDVAEISEDMRKSDLMADDNFLSPADVA